MPPRKAMKCDSAAHHFEIIKQNITCCSCKAMRANIIHNEACEHTLCSNCVKVEMCPICNVKLSPVDLQDNSVINGVAAAILEAVQIIKANKTSNVSNDKKSNAVSNHGERAGIQQEVLTEKEHKIIEVPEESGISSDKRSTPKKHNMFSPQGSSTPLPSLHKGKRHEAFSNNEEKNIQASTETVTCTEKHTTPKKHAFSPQVSSTSLPSLHKGKRQEAFPNNKEKNIQASTEMVTCAEKHSTPKKHTFSPQVSSTPLPLQRKGKHQVPFQNNEENNIEVPTESLTCSDKRSTSKKPMFSPQESSIPSHTPRAKSSHSGLKKYEDTKMKCVFESYAEKQDGSKTKSGILSGDVKKATDVENKRSGIEIRKSRIIKKGSENSLIRNASVAPKLSGNGNKSIEINERDGSASIKGSDNIVVGNMSVISDLDTTSESLPVSSDNSNSKIDDSLLVTSSRKNISLFSRRSKMLEKSRSDVDESNMSNNINASKLLKRNAKGETSLHTACKNKNTTLLKQLLDNGMNPNVKDYAGWTPLHEAVVSESIECAELLLKNGASVNVPGLEFVTPLHKACIAQNPHMIRLLRNYNADETSRDLYGYTPSYYAIPEVAKIFELPRMVALFQKEVFALEKPQLVMICNEAMNDDLKNAAASLYLKVTQVMTKDVTIVVTSNEKVCPISYPVLYGMLCGATIVTSHWVLDCAARNKILQTGDYEVMGTEDYPHSGGPLRARKNAMKLLPELFSGFEICVRGRDTGQLSRIELINLLKVGGAKFLTREPNPEDEDVVRYPYHCQPRSSMEVTSSVILYHDKKPGQHIRYNMRHLKTLPVDWFLRCIQTFSIAEPFF